MDTLNLPLHPTMRHPLTGAPLRAIAERPGGGYVWPMMGGAPDDNPDDKKPEDKKPEDDKKPDDKPEDKKPERKPGVPTNYAIDGEGKSLGYPVETPLEQMKAEEREAYLTHQMRTHEARNKALLKLTGGKYGKELEADMKELADLRRAKMTDAERAIEDAKQEGKQEAVSTASLKIAAQFFDVSLDHVDAERRKVLIESIDLSKVVTSDGTIDTDKVRILSETLAPRPGKGRDPDYGGGRRASSAPTGSVASVMQARREAREAKQRQSTS